jgi:hypothetical protein
VKTWAKIHAEIDSPFHEKVTRGFAKVSVETGSCVRAWKAKQHLWREKKTFQAKALWKECYRWRVADDIPLLMGIALELQVFHRHCHHYRFHLKRRVRIQDGNEVVDAVE